MRRGWIRASIPVYILLIVLLVASCAYAKQYSIADEIKSKGKANVIIMVDSQRGQYAAQPTKASRDYQASIGEMHTELTDEINNIGTDFRNKKDLYIINGYSGTITAFGYARLIASGLDIKIYPDVPLKIQPVNGDPANKAIDLNTENLNISTAAVGANYSWNVLNMTGTNITVAVVDTGVDYNHSAFGNCYNSTGCRIVAGWDFYNDDSDPMDDNGHGTHVAGIIAANGIVRGVAPSADIMPLKVCDSSGGNCQQSYVIAAIQYAVGHGAKVISISLGASMSANTYGNTGFDPISAAVDSAVSQGVPVAIAAGNDGPGISTLASPGASYLGFSVANVNDEGTVNQTDDIIAGDSSRGPAAFGRLAPTVSAPGTSIISTWPGNTTHTLSGTSMATPHVSGIMALMLQYSPNITMQKLRALLVQTSANITGKLFEHGAGEINVQNAMTANEYVIVHGVNEYGSVVDDAEWDMVAVPSVQYQENITFFNDNPYNITVNTSKSSFESLENQTLNVSGLSLPSTFNVANNSNITIIANITLTGTPFVSTYAGLIQFTSSGNSTTRYIRLPVVVTVPILYYSDHLKRTMTYSGSSAGDVLYYAYYNVRSSSENFLVNWTFSGGQANDLDIYLYNHSAILIDYGGFDNNLQNTTNESLQTANTSSIKWLRMQGFDFATSPFGIDITITDNSNSDPAFTTISDINGNNASLIISNSSNASYYSMNFSMYKNITIVAGYSDPDGDNITMALNDSRYTMSNHSQYQSAFNLSYYSTAQSSHNLTMMLNDSYGGQTSAVLVINVFDPLSILNYTPSNYSVYIGQSALAQFTESSNDSEGRQLYYRWFVNGTLNSTSQNFTLNASQYSIGSYNITFAVTNNLTNKTVSWNVTIDNITPIISIASPIAITYTAAFVNMTYTATDIAGIDRCWYTVDSGSAINITSCTNITFYLGNASHTLTIYANDTVGNIGSANVTFNISDSTPPTILLATPDSHTFSSSTTVVTIDVTTNENATCRYSDDVDELYGAMHAFSVDNVTDHTKNYPVSAGGYTIYIRCMDTAGNKDSTSTTIEFSVNSPSSSGSGGGGSGGSSGGGPLFTDNTAAPAYSYHFRRIFLDVSHTLDFHNDELGMAMTELSADLNSTKKFGQITIESQEYNDSSLPASASYFTSGTRYAVFDIIHDGLSDSDINDVNITFKVPKLWVSQNNIDNATIKLYRYMLIWNAVPTVLVRSDNTYYYYVAKSPGLSSYIIAGNELKPVQQPAIQNQTVNNTVQRKPIEDPSLHTMDNSTQSLGSAGSNMNIIYAIISIVAVVGLIIFFATKKSAKEWLNKNKEFQQPDNRVLSSQYMNEGKKIQQLYLGQINALRQKGAKENDPKIEFLHKEYNSKIAELKTAYEKKMKR